jgi:hypothetical protein
MNGKTKCTTLGCLLLAACGSSSNGGADPGPVDAGMDAVEEVAPPPLCSKPIVITLGNGGIDDFELGASRWSSFQDGTGMLTGTTVNNGPTESNAGDVPGSQAAAHLHGSGFTDSGAGLSYTGWIKCVDISAFTGISFWAKGGAGTGMTLADKPRVALVLPTTLPVERGGACTSGCNDHPSAPITLTEQWKQYFVAWTLLQQSGVGTPAPFTDKTVLGFNISFLGVNTGTSFDLWLDSVQLFN